MRALFAAAVFAAALAVAGCGDDDDDGVPAATTVPAATSSASPAASVAADASPTLAAAPPGVRAPGTYEDPDGKYTFQYPPAWDLEVYDEKWVRLATFPLEGRIAFPPGSILIDVDEVPGDQLSRPSGATDTTLDGEAAWSLERPGASPTGGGEASWRHQHWVGIVRGSTGYLLSASYGDSQPDQAIFLALLESFRFLEP